MGKILNIEPLSFPWQTKDPFLFCAHHKDAYPKGNSHLGIDQNLLKGRQIGNDFIIKDGWRMYHGTSIPGFPYHPHRGFETITINVQGVVDHSDSLGAKGRFMGGDVQWMTAGKGIQHSEMFPMLNSDQPNPLEIFQIWLNLPRISKMVEPHFKMLWKEDIPVIKHIDENGHQTEIKLIVGQLNEKKALTPPPNSWAANPNHHVNVYLVEMSPKAHWILPETHPKSHRVVYFYKGDLIEIEEQKIASNHLIELKPEAIDIINIGQQSAQLLILEGIPINEPVVQHGPFVMNSIEEIRETMKEYGRTQFGGWPWPEKKMVHGKAVGRFALYKDGKIEKR